MRKKHKITYHKPELQEIVLDRTILLKTVSVPADDTIPPGDPFGVASSNSETSPENTSIINDALKQNSFEENPFQR